MKYVPVTIRGVTKLEEKRCQQASEIALGGIFEIEIIIGN
jgi:hypothetical protein